MAPAQQIGSAEEREFESDGLPVVARSKRKRKFYNYITGLCHQLSEMLSPLSRTANPGF